MRSGFTCAWCSSDGVYLPVRTRVACIPALCPPPTSFTMSSPIISASEASTPTSWPKRSHKVNTTVWRATNKSKTRAKSNTAVRQTWHRWPNKVELMIGPAIILIKEPNWNELIWMSTQRRNCTSLTEARKRAKRSSKSIQNWQRKIKLTKKFGIERQITRFKKHTF